MGRIRSFFARLSATHFVMIAACVMLTGGIIAGVLLVQSPGLLALVPGGTYNTSNVFVGTLDRTLPQSSAGASTISTRQAQGTHGVTVTVFSIDTVSRSITFNVNVPAGYRFVGAIEGTSSAVSASVSAAIITDMRTRLNNHNFTTQFSLNNLTLAAFNRVNAQTGFINVFVVPVVNFNMNFNNGVNTTTQAVTIRHPDALPRPTHPEGAPFIRWNTTIAQAAVLNSSNIVANGTLHAQWLVAPTITLDGSVIRWANTPGAQGHEVWINGQRFGVASNQWNIRVSATNNRLWNPGINTVEVRSTLGTGAAMVFSAFSNTISYNEQRERLPTPTNFRMVNGETLVWDPIVSTSNNIGHMFTNMGWMSISGSQNFRDLEMMSWHYGLTMNSNLQLEARCLSQNYLVSEPSPVFTMLSLPDVILPPLADPQPEIVERAGLSMLRWAPVPNATGYSVMFMSWNWGWQDVVLSFTYDQIPLMLASGELAIIDGYFHYPLWWIMSNWGVDNFNLRLTAFGDFVNFGSSNAITDEYQTSWGNTLEIQNLRVEGGYLVWDAWQTHTMVFGAMISVNGVNVGAQRNIEQLIIEQGLGTGEHTIEVQVFGDGWSTVGATATYTLTITEQLSTPTISITGSTINWTWDNNASSYAIYRNGTLMTWVLNIGFVGGNAFLDLDSLGLGLGTHSITIRAMGQSFFTDSYHSNSVIFNVGPTQLATPTGFALSGGLFTWGGDATPADVVYQIEVQGHGTMSISTRNITTEDIISAFGLSLGTFDVRVRAYSNNPSFTHSEWTSTVSFTRSPIQLATPTGLVMNDGMLSWNAVANATGYTVYVMNVANLTTTEFTATTNSFDIGELDLLPGWHAIVVRATITGNIYFTNSAQSGALTYQRIVQLTAPTGIDATYTVVGAGALLEVSWTAVTHAVSYNVYLNGELIGNTASTTLSHTLATRLAPGIHNITVVALGNSINILTSVPSSQFPFTVTTTLAVASGLAISNNVLTWNAVEWATGFVVIGPGNARVYTGTGRFLNLVTAFGQGVTKPGTMHQFSVVALGDGEFTFDSLPISITLDNAARTLAVPQVTLSQSATIVTLTWAIDSSWMWDGELVAEFYLIVNGNLQSSAIGAVVLGNTAMFAWAAQVLAEEFGFGTHDFQIIAAGNGTNFIDSAPSDIVEINIQQTTLATPTGISIDGDRVVWDAVSGGVSGLTVYVDGVDTITVTTNFVYISDLNLGIGTFAIRVRAIGSFMYADSAQSIEYVDITRTATQILAPTGVTRNGDLIEWNAVANASFYRVYLNGVASSGNLTVRQFNIATILLTLPHGTHEFSVRAVGDGTEFYLDSPRSTSVDVVITITLGQPQLTLSNGLLTWGAIANATHYSVYVDGIRVAYANVLQFDLNTLSAIYFGTGQVSVLVYAHSNNPYINNSIAATTQFVIQPIQLGVPMGLNISGGEIAWNPVTHSTGNYRVYIEGGLVATSISHNVTGTSLNLATLGLRPGTHSIRVRAIGNGDYLVDSNQSLSIQHTVANIQLSAPSNLRLAGGQLLWDSGLTGVGHFVILIDGNARTTTNTTFIDVNDLNLGLGIFQVTVFASAFLEYLDSGTSNSVTLTLDTTLLAPALHINQDNVLTWGAVANATGYIVYINGVPHAFNLAQGRAVNLNFLNNFVGNHTIEVRAVGNGSYIADSAWASIVHTVTPRQLATPVATIGADNILSWNAVTEASDFWVYVQGLLRFRVSGETSFDLETLGLRPGTFAVHVRAIGNGDYILDSAQSAAVSFVVPRIQLETPTNVRVQGARIEWDSDGMAGGYRVQIGGQTLEVSTSHVYIANLITTFDLVFGIHAVSVRAIGDVNYYIASAPSGTVDLVHSTTLGVVQNVIVGEDRMLRFDAVAHALHYRIYVNGILHLDNVTTTVVNVGGLFNTLPAGNHAITVVAIGDGVVFFDSATSDNAPFTVLIQLETPDVEIEDGVLGWEEVANALGYRIYIGNVYFDTILQGENLEFDLSILCPREFGVGAVMIRIVAFNADPAIHDSFAASFRHEIMAIVLETPQYLYIDSYGILHWGHVYEATGFAIYVGANRVGTTENLYFDIGALNLPVGEHSIRVIAIGNATYLANSTQSESTSFIVADASEEAPSGIDIIMIAGIAGGLLVAFGVLAVLVFRRRR